MIKKGSKQELTCYVSIVSAAVLLVLNDVGVVIIKVIVVVLVFHMVVLMVMVML